MWRERESTGFGKTIHLRSMHPLFQIWCAMWNNLGRQFLDSVRESDGINTTGNRVISGNSIERVRVI